MKTTVYGTSDDNDLGPFAKTIASLKAISAQLAAERDKVRKEIKELDARNADRQSGNCVPRFNPFDRTDGRVPFKNGDSVWLARAVNKVDRLTNYLVVEDCVNFVVVKDGIDTCMIFHVNDPNSRLFRHLEAAQAYLNDFDQAVSAGRQG